MVLEEARARVIIAISGPTRLKNIQLTTKVSVRCSVGNSPVGGLTGEDRLHGPVDSAGVIEAVAIIIFATILCRV